jgi:hypothetical protein
MVQLTYFPVWPDDEPAHKTYQCARGGCTNTSPNRYCDACATAPGVLRHGYHLTDLHSIARLAVHTAGAMATSWHERYDVAYSAVAEHLYSCEAWPPRSELVRAGQLGIYAVVDEDRQAHGYYKRKTIGAAAGPGSSPAFQTFWEAFGRSTGSCERGVVEEIALWQILPTLPPVLRAALMALAAHGNYQDAAAALGVEYSSFKSQIARARRRFLALWHEGEKPSRQWGCDRRAGRVAGEERTGGARTAMSAISRRRGRIADALESGGVSS